MKAPDANSLKPIWVLILKAHCVAQKKGSSPRTTNPTNLCRKWRGVMKIVWTGCSVEAWGEKWIKAQRRITRTCSFLVNFMLENCMQHALIDTETHPHTYTHTLTLTGVKYIILLIPPGCPVLLSVWSEVTACLERLRVWWGFSRQAGESAGVANHRSSQDPGSWIRERSLPRCSAPKDQLWGLWLKTHPQFGSQEPNQRREMWGGRKTKACGDCIF